MAQGAESVERWCRDVGRRIVPEYLVDFLGEPFLKSVYEGRREVVRIAKED